MASRTRRTTGTSRGVLGKRRTYSGRGYGRSGKRFRKGYDRVGGLYKLYGKTKPSGELKYLDKGLWNDKTIEIDDDVDNMALWTKADGTNANGDVFENGKWYIIQSLVNNKQGQGAQQRIGRKITVKSIFKRFGFIATNIVTLNDQGINDGLPTHLQMRIVLVVDKQYNGQVVKASDIFEPTAGGDNGNILGRGYQPAIVQLPNVANSQRFRVIKDKTWNFSTEGTVPIQMTDEDGTFTYSEVTIQKLVEFYKKINLEIENAANDATLNGIKSNNIIMAVTWNGMGATGVNFPDESNADWSIKPFGLSRIRYTDM